MVSKDVYNFILDVGSDRDVVIASRLMEWMGHLSCRGRQLVNECTVLMLTLRRKMSCDRGVIAVFN
jgi:hypothetical protein